MKKYFGQFYSKNLKEDIEKYKNTIKNNSDKIFLEPFVGEGDLLFMYLDIMEELGYSSKELFKNNKIRCYDISKENVNKLRKKLIDIGFENVEESIKENDSLKINPLKGQNTFIITNPPYLYKVAAKKLNYDMSYYEKYIDLYEVAINLYKEDNGIWIVPSNIFFSSHIKVLGEIIENIDNIYLFKETKFSDTDISITIFEINKEVKNKTLTINNTIYNIKNKKLDFPEISKSSKSYKYKFGFYDKDIEEDGLEYLLDNKDRVKSNLNVDNSLIIKMFDSTKSEDIGLYNVNDIIDEDIMFNKISSRMYFQIFFDKEVNIEKLKIAFNKRIVELRKKYDSSFLTNFLSTSKNNSFNRKRMAIAQAKSILNEEIKKLNL